MDDGRLPVPRGGAPAVHYAAPADTAGLETLWRVMRRRVRIVALTMAAVVLLALAIALSRPQIYESTALVMVTPPTAMMSPDSESAPQTKIENDEIETQVQLLQSRALKERVVDNLGLVNDPAWNPAARNRNRSFSAASAARERRDVLAKLSDAYVVERQGRTQVIAITAQSENPEDAARIANGVASNFLDARDEARGASVNRSLDWLTRRTTELQEEVQAKEAAVEAYRAETGILDSAGVTLSEQQIANVQTDVLAARAELAASQARLNEVRRLRDQGGSIDNLPSALTSDTISQLRAREADIARQQAQLSERYGERHPALQNIRQEREGIQQAIAAEVSRIAASAQSEVNVAQTRLNALQSGMSSARRELTGDNQAALRLAQLEREAEAARAVYQGFMQRRHALAAQGELLGASAEVVSSADTPSAPAGRSVIVILLIGVAAGALLGVLAAFTFEHLDPRVITADDVEKLGAPILSTAPLLKSRDLDELPASDAHPAGYLRANPLSGFAESYRVLRSAINRAAPRGPSKVVAVTSALPGDGKTTSAFCLAQTYAAAGYRVLLIDCDLRRRSLNHILGIEPLMGLLQVLERQTTWQDVVGVDEPSGVHVLPAASTREPSIDGFEGRRLRALLDELRTAYQVVILDCPPILSLAEVREIVQEADHTLVVARSGKTPTPALATALRQVEAAGGAVVGVALNGVDRHSAGKFSYADPLYFTPSAKAFYTA
jgi:polysaccharide biosynthesis transport protein